MKTEEVAQDPRRTIFSLGTDRLLRTSQNGNFDKYLSLTAGLLIIIGAKLWLIAARGSSTPYWDQWDGEAAFLFKPFIDGNLPLSQLFAYHNEHRIFFTRIFALSLLWLNHYWDPILEMIVNGLLHTLAIGVLFAIVFHKLNRGSFFIFCSFAAFCFALPFGWENILAGFQSQFYFLMLFSILSVWLFYECDAFSKTWWLGLICAIAAYLSMASGALTIAAGLGISLLQTLLGQRRGWKEFVAMGVLGALVLVTLKDIPTLSYHDELKAHTLTQFLGSFYAAAGWPITKRPIIASVFIYAPLFLVALGVFRDRSPKGDFRWFVVGIGIWLILQIASLAYGRAVGTLSSRYLDILVLGLAINLLCILVILERLGSRRHLVHGGIGLAWLILVSFAVYGRAHHTLPGEIAEKYRETTTETANLSNYLTTGNFDFLTDKPLLDIPYPSAQRLRDIVSMPEVRAILPPNLVGQSDRAADDSHALLTNAVRRLKVWSLKAGRLLFPVGVFLLIATGMGMILANAKRARAAISAA